VTLAVDSYGPRGISNTCSEPISADILDGYAALDFLVRQSDVDGSKVALLGTSRGGGLTLISVEQGAIERLSKRKFKAAVALYPPCVGDSGLVTIPTLVLIGASDDWTPADDCRDMAAGHSSIGVSRGPGDRLNLRLVVYPGAYHSFDNDRLQPGLRYFGHWVEYNDAATLASVEQVRTFLQHELGGQ
jgi:dienelactone hydrolase